MLLFNHKTKNTIPLTNKQITIVYFFTNKINFREITILIYCAIDLL